MNTGSDGHLAPDAQPKPFLASPIFLVPWVSWQAWVLGATLRQRRGSPSGQQLWRPAVFVAGVVLLFLFAQAWLGRVLVHVPEPYLVRLLSCFAMSAANPPPGRILPHPAGAKVLSRPLARVG